MLSRISPEQAREIIINSKIAPLVFPIPARADHADHIIKTALDGHTKLAADHVLHPQMKGQLMNLAGSITRRLSILLSSNPGKDLEEMIINKYRIYDTLLEIIWNLLGVEREWAGFSEDESEKTIAAISNFLKECEDRERKEIGNAVIIGQTIMLQLDKAKVVNKTNSMVAWMASEIEKAIKEDDLIESYVASIKETLNTNFYYTAYRQGFCKFGNDYALGLRWLRHLGYVQVSTNPVLAAIAYDDDPSLWVSFKKYVREELVRDHPEWFREPEKYVDDMVMEATMFVLLDNFYTFRIPFLLSKYQNGLVSYQLNPLIADNAERSVAIAKDFARRLENILLVYDSYLLWGYDGSFEKGRPNLVIKVAAAYPSSIEIARMINEVGIGQNITLSYTLSQEILTGIAAMEGMARALKKGIIPTQTYLTNMGGRLEDHLLEYVAANLLLKAFKKISSEEKDSILKKLAKEIKMNDEKLRELKNKNIRECVEILTSKEALGGNLLNCAYVKALVSTRAYGDENNVINMLTSISNAIKLSGTYVAKRVYEIMFSPWNRLKWVNYLVSKLKISREEANLIMSRIDLLPASKRKSIDTVFTMSRRNVTNTEFPDHQLKVMKDSFREGFRMEDYRESISRKLEDKYLAILMEIEDFVKAYEVTPELRRILEEVGIREDYGNRGVKPEDWPRYAPCEKTLREFTKAYLAFRDRVKKALEE
jgi:hypothetical protein